MQLYRMTRKHRHRVEDPSVAPINSLRAIGFGKVIELRFMQLCRAYNVSSFQPLRPWRTITEQS